jgi:NDP-sugar pyrophosphorylase family protein
MKLAVFLLAGGGIRLRPYTYEIPKCLVEVNGKKLLIRMLDYLAQGGIEKVIMVIGYKGEKIREAIGKTRNGMEIEYVDNKDWATTNNVVSLNLAAPQIDDDFILLEGDLIFTYEAFKPLFKPDRMAVDNYREYMNGTLVDVDDNDLVKQFIVDKNLSENKKSKLFKTVNLYSFKYESFKNLIIPKLNDLIKSEQKQVYYEQAIADAVADSNYKTKAVNFDKTLWYEIDTEEDLLKAEELFSGTYI